MMLQGVSVAAVGARGGGAQGARRSGDPNLGLLRALRHNPARTVAQRCLHAARDVGGVDKDLGDIGESPIGQYAHCPNKPSAVIRANIRSLRRPMWNGPYCSRY